MEFFAHFAKKSLACQAQQACTAHRQPKLFPNGEEKKLSLDTILLINHTLTDEQIKLFCQTISENIKELFVLPAQIRRVKQLLFHTNIKIGSFIDYPLASGTKEKNAFEIAHTIKEGADVLEIFLPLIQIKTQNWRALYKEIALYNSITHTHVEVRYAIIHEEITELEKIYLARNMNALGIHAGAIHFENTNDALHVAELFQFEAPNNFQMNMNIQHLDLRKVERLHEKGVKNVGSIITSI